MRTNICLLLIIVFAWFIVNCENTREYEEEKYGGVVFTFDDADVNAWWNLHNILKNKNWRATFFVSGYDKLNSNQIDLLKKLNKYGHEIGGHSINHFNAREYVQGNGISAYLETEILPMINLMEADGFQLTSFAYPYGARTAQIDQALLPYFEILRGTFNAAREPHLQLCYFNENSFVFGLGIDMNWSWDIEYIYSLLDYAKDEDKIVIFYAHNPHKIVTGNYQITFQRMIDLCNYVNQNKIKFYTISELLKMN